MPPPCGEGDAARNRFVPPNWEDKAHPNNSPATGAVNEHDPGFLPAVSRVAGDRSGAVPSGSYAVVPTPFPDGP